MATLFFPSCKTAAALPEESARLAEYLQTRHGIAPIGCCRTHHSDLQPGDTALTVCNNCMNIISENAQADIVSVWELIDEDDTFQFPDWHGEQITLQDCWLSHERSKEQDAVRSLMRKMNIEIVEMEEMRADNRFCGTILVMPMAASTAKLAHRHYVEEHPEMFTPLPKEEWPAHFAKHCGKIATPKVACYCKSCWDGLNLGGSQALHLLQLLFPKG